MLACAKHLVGGGVPENGLNGASSELSERTLHEVFYPPFIKALEAGAYTLMPSHNDVNGIPCHADAHMLGGLLRGALELSGLRDQRLAGYCRLHSVHRVAATRRDADRMALLAGVDMHMHGGEFFENVCSLVLEGRCQLGRIDDAVRKILLAKFRLGLFEQRYSKPEQIQAVVLAPAHVHLALEASRKSIVLLHNDRGLLPLEGARSLLVTGPNADDQSILGDWARIQPAANVVTILQGLRSVAAPGVRVDHAAVGPIAHISDAQIQAAVSAAAAVDVIIAVVGENSLRDNPERTLGENVDRVSLESTRSPARARGCASRHG